MSTADETLNDAQRAAVEITDGPVLVVAGAGTGKTKVIVERIMQLLEQGTSPESILALTFTEKAAGEMLDRVNSARSGVTLDATIATFNGFGNDLLQAYGREWGLGTLRLMGETGQLVFLREHLDELELDYFAPVSNPEGQLSLLSDYVSLLKQQLIRPEDYHAFAAGLPHASPEDQLEKQKQQELAQFFDTYQRLCRAHQVIDYDDQLYLTIELLKARPNILQQLQARYQYVLVDEFQDTNPMQSALVDLLAAKTQNIMVVGDDDQSIYGWRGATLANILDFKKRYPAAQDVTLIENYRSTQAILDAAYRLIQHNNPNRLEVMNQLNKRLRANIGQGIAPVARHFATLDAELAWVAEDIAERLGKHQNPSGIAVLARRTVSVMKLHEVLEMNGIDHAVAGLSNDLYAVNAVRQLIEGLKALADPHDDLALFHTLIGPLLSVNPTALAKHAATARKEHEHLLIVLEREADDELKQALQTFQSWQQQAHEHTVGSLAYQIITDSGWKQDLYERAEHDGDIFTQVQALSQYFKTLKEFERVAGVASVHNYVVSLPALQSAGSGFDDASLDISDTQVNVLSVHRSKGLEWDTVYIIDCSEGSFPMRNFGGGLQVPATLRSSSSAADEHMAEERRLMYVAATRARKELILTHADQHGSGAKRKPSRFLDEMLGSERGELQAATSQTSLELFAPKTNQLSSPLPAALAKDGCLQLSVSQIDCWLRCPLDFYYQYVLQMPLPPAPQLQYGTAIHSVIETIHRDRTDGRPVAPLADYKEQVKLALPREGYASARSRERAHAQAMKTVEAVYERFVQADLPLETEKPFAVELFAGKLKVIGRIDAVYQNDGGVEIRDFKTGTSVTTADKAKSRATASNQLTLYALAWQTLHDEMPALLTLDFVETNQAWFGAKTSQVPGNAD